MSSDVPPQSPTSPPPRPRPLSISRQSSDSHSSQARRRPSRRQRHSEGDVLANAPRPTARHSLSGSGPQDPAQPGLQTLQEFLTQIEQDGGSDHRPSPSREAHRPRRVHALSESSRRPGPYHPSQYATGPRSPRVTGLRSPRSPIALSSPPSLPLDDGGAVVHPGSRMAQSTYVKPRWQPDAEVSSCPICEQSFSFWFRKHHCRKCGRVVCSQCSPHRITIPRQFIVEPPGEDSDDGDTQREVLSPAAELEGGLADSIVFGGHEVRLCNPCVPDPQPLPPHGYNGPSTTAADVLATFPPDVDGHGVRYPARTSSQNRDWIGAYPGELHRQRSSTDPHRGGLRSPTGLRPRPDDAQVLSSGMHRMSLPPAPPNHSHPYHTARYGHRAGQSLGVLPTAPLNTNAPLPPVPRQIRRIAEEDECPICHNELPAKGPDGDETEREAHITTCIEESLTGASRSIPSSAPPVPVLAQASSVPAQSSLSSAAGPSRPRAETQADPSAQYAGWRRSNMLVYKATEKDCIDAEGRTKECVICLDDFVEGDELGRLECWCTFHRKCIRSWWDQKGVGACPLHQHQEGL